MGIHEAAGLMIAALQAMGGWKLGVLLIVCLMMPAFLTFFMLSKAIQTFILLRDEIRESIRESNRRYDNNVILIEQYERISRELLSVVKSNTEAFIHLSDIIEQQAKRGVR